MFFVAWGAFLIVSQQVAIPTSLIGGSQPSPLALRCLGVTEEVSTKPPTIGLSAGDLKTDRPEKPAGSAYGSRCSLCPTAHLGPS